MRVKSAGGALAPKFTTYRHSGLGTHYFISRMDIKYRPRSYACDMHVFCTLISLIFEPEHAVSCMFATVVITYHAARSESGGEPVKGAFGEY